MKEKLHKVLKFTYCGIAIFIFFSCQKNLTQTQPTVSINILDTSRVQPSAIVAGKFLSIDSLNFVKQRQTANLSGDINLNEKIKNKVNKFYITNSYKTKWLTENMPSVLYYAFVDIIKKSSLYGLQENDYPINSIEEQLHSIYNSQPISATAITDLDINITEIFFLFTTHLKEGKIRTTGNTKGVWMRESKATSDVDITLLLDADTGDELVTTIDKLQPTLDQYGKLQKALSNYRALQQTNPGSFPAITAKEKIKPNDKHAAVPLIRQKLFLTDLNPYALPIDSSTGLCDSLRYDQELVTAVKWFQARHGLEPDGIIGEKTIKFLNQSIKEKADLIALNMERMRWLPDNYGDYYILVNIPEFKLRLYEKQQTAFEMKVIVGSVDKPTPVFTDMLEHIVFSPTWTVPVSILKEEIIPRLRKDSLYYSAKNYAFYKNEVQIDPGSESWKSESINPYQYKVVQQPGPDNSLGLVKFIMPNNMNVYLHDTPNHSLFSKHYRALSHGCIRLDEPAKFAEFLLRDKKGWDKEAINKAMHMGTSSTILLKKKCKVFIEYRTVWVDQNDVVNFREDIYGHDKHQLHEFFTVEKDSAPLAGI